MKGALLVHGNHLCAAFYEPLGQRLAALGVRAHATTLPGFHGEPPLDPPSHDALARRVVEAFETHVADGGALIAHSLGALIALCAAARRPKGLERLVLLEPAVIPSRWLARRAAKRYAREAIAPAEPTFRNRVGGVRRIADPARYPRWAIDLWLAGQQSADAATQARLFEDLPALYPLPLRDVVVPTLVLRGERSGPGMGMAHRWLARALPDARLETVRGAAHWIANERDAETAARIARFVRSGEPARTPLGERLATAQNGALRAAALRSFVALGAVLHLVVRWKVARLRPRQEALRRRYRIAPETPIVGYGEEVRAAVDRLLAERPDARPALTSGSTADPKRIAYPKERLRRIKRGSLSVAARAVSRLGVGRAALFILAGLDEDGSLTALLLDAGSGGASYGEGLVTPSAYLRHPAVRALVARYGAAAVRLWLLVLSDPGLIYSTNPSTLAVWLHTLEGRWTETTRLVVEHLRDPASFDPEIGRVARRVASPRWRERAARIAAATGPLPVRAMLPSLSIYTCWDGGYVRPFLDAIARHLPTPPYRLLPMYSMSTEVVETLPVFEGREVRFAPLAPGVLYEFVPDDAPDEPSALEPAWALEPGRAYAMVVSDGYGLRRYQTDDLFLCAGRMGDAPDLRFLRRRELSYSFTGEKLTGAHLTCAYERVRADVPSLRGIGLTCIPREPEHADDLPGYVVVLAPTGDPAEVRPLGKRAASLVDAALQTINAEYASKRASHRLAAPRACVIPYDELAAALEPKATTEDAARGRVWESQFKLLPLYRRTWGASGLRTRSGLTP